MSSEARASEENKHKVRRFYEEVFGQGNLDAVEEIFASNYVLHDRDQDPAQDPETSSVCGLGGIQNWVKGFREAFSDPTVSIIENPMAAEGNRVVIRFKVSGSFKALLSSETQETPVEWEGISISKFSEEGKITESWSYWESGRMYETLGYFDYDKMKKMMLTQTSSSDDWRRPPRR